MSAFRNTFFMFAFLMTLSMAASHTSRRTKSVIAKARVVLVGSSTVKGSLNLTQSDHQSGVLIVGKITGLTPGKHGFHIHEFGDVYTQGCNSTGAHFNPLKMPKHGPKEADVLNRHRGDLGNIVADAKGVATINMVDKLIALIPKKHYNNNVVVGRAFVVHALKDDLGKGGNKGSLATGNAGARLACGTIALV